VPSDFKTKLLSPAAEIFVPPAITGCKRAHLDRKRMPKNNTMTFDFGFMVFPSFMSIICERQNEESLQRSR
jgi:hypothetical protein